MKSIVRILTYVVVIAAIVVIHALFFLHHPPEFQLAFLTPGVTLLGYCIIRDDYYKKPTIRWAREKRSLQSERS